MQEERRIELNICSPHQPVRVISAKVSGQISALHVLFNNNNKNCKQLSQTNQQKTKFIYNGSFLTEDLTFNECGLSDGDSIIAIRMDDTDDNGLFQWLSLTKDNDEFHEMVRTMLNPNTCNEAARLRDLHLIRLERNPQIFKKMVFPFQSQDDEEAMRCTPSSSGLAATQFSMISSNEPSTDALPILW